MPKRNNLVSNVCPICGHNFTLGDGVPPKLTLKETFGYRENNFYGDKIKLFMKGKCCREYYLYLMAKDPSFIVKDIEPVDYPKFLQDLNKEVRKDEAVEVEEQTLPEPDTTEIKTEKELNGKSIDDYKYYELMKLAKEKYGTNLPKNTKGTELREWFATNTREE